MLAYVFCKFIVSCTIVHISVETAIVDIVFINLSIRSMYLFIMFYIIFDIFFSIKVV